MASLMYNRKHIAWGSVGIWFINWAAGDALSTAFHSAPMNTLLVFVQSHMSYLGAFGIGMLISAYWYDIGNIINGRTEKIKRELMEISARGIREILGMHLSAHPTEKELINYFKLEEKWAQEVEAILKKYNLEDEVYEFGNLGGFPIQQFTHNQEENRIKTMFTLHNDILKRIIKSCGKKSNT